MNKLKKIILGILSTAVISGGVLVYPIEPESLTYNEYQALIELYNFEISQMGGQITLNDIKDRDDIIIKWHEKIRARKIPPIIEIDKEVLTDDEYLILREGMMQRVEKTNLLKNIQRQFNN